MPLSRGQKISAERLKERDRAFGDVSADVWQPSEKAFGYIPRILPLILHLLTKGGKSGGGNPARVYVDLWTRSFEAGFLRVEDEDSLAYSAGYTTKKRNIRTWSDHMKLLEKEGFIRSVKRNNKPFGYVLLLNPYLVVARKLKKGEIKDETWIASFVSRLSEINPTVPDELEQALKARKTKK